MWLEPLTFSVSLTCLIHDDIKNFYEVLSVDYVLLVCIVVLEKNCITAMNSDVNLCTFSSHMMNITHFFVVVYLFVSIFYEKLKTILNLSVKFCRLKGYY